MGIHPNAILLLTLTPDDLARKTYRNILADTNTEDDYDIKIEGNNYHYRIMEDSYDKSYQIAAKEGDIILFNYITYGYGEVIEWDEVEKQKKELEAWAKMICEKHNCSYKIFITANYW